MYKKKKIQLYAAYKRLILNKDTCRFKVRGWKNIYHANEYQKKARVAILILDKIDFKTKTITRDKEGHYHNKGDNQKKKI